MKLQKLFDYIFDRLNWNRKLEIVDNIDLNPSRDCIFFSYTSQGSVWLSKHYAVNLVHC